MPRATLPDAPRARAREIIADYLLGLNGPNVYDAILDLVLMTDVELKAFISTAANARIAANTAAITKLPADALAREAALTTENTDLAALDAAIL
jgi:hypothetical protein